MVLLAYLDHWRPSILSLSCWLRSCRSTLSHVITLPVGAAQVVHTLCAHVRAIYDTVVTVITFILGLPAATIRYVCSIPARVWKVRAMSGNCRAEILLTAVLP